ncbi:protein of unknown function [Bartonella clarridgeiae 73]|uniref:Uncharacterized protein n=1 Tax=Bartonella clarridgeiae (strain CCUG 45776 / CIP 104772 / 73) TaxID=696125 RepID=E6YJ16_BARC7|nr:protein of unknown function [Bartonella clarridgeiae 73]
MIQYAVSCARNDEHYPEKKKEINSIKEKIISRKDDPLRPPNIAFNHHSLDFFHYLC